MIINNNKLLCVRLTIFFVGHERVSARTNERGVKGIVNVNSERKRDRGWEREIEVERERESASVRNVWDESEREWEGKWKREMKNERWNNGWWSEKLMGKERKILKLIVWIMKRRKRGERGRERKREVNEREGEGEKWMREREVNERERERKWEGSKCESIMMAITMAVAIIRMIMMIKRWQCGRACGSGWYGTDWPQSWPPSPSSPRIDTVLLAIYCLYYCYV